MDNNKAFVEAIVNRMKTVLGVLKDKEVSDYFGSSRSLTGVWKTRGSIPIAECIRLAQEKGASLDYLILGREPGAALPGGEDARAVSHVDLPVFDMANFFDLAPGVSWSVPRAWLVQESLCSDDTILVRAVDDSMRPTIAAGQLVLVDQRPHSGDGVYLVRFGDVVRIKRLQQMADGSIRLSCDNPAYGVDMIPAGDEARMQVIGHCHASITAVR